MLDRMTKAKEQWEKRQTAQEAEISTLKATLEELNSRGQARASEIEKLTAANLAVASKEAELESTLKVLREEHRVWQEKDIALSKELNTVKAQAEDSMRRAKQVRLNGFGPSSIDRNLSLSSGPTPFASLLPFCFESLLPFCFETLLPFCFESLLPFCV